jgi:hypothetical protein
MPTYQRVSLAPVVRFDKREVVLAAGDRETRRLLSRRVSRELEIELSNRKPAPRHLTRIWNAAAERTARHLISVILCVSMVLFWLGCISRTRKPSRHETQRTTEIQSGVGLRLPPHSKDLKCRNTIRTPADAVAFATE